jgi:leader peptidase (prepilin peptidase) / N-methyltransferase
VIVSDLSPWLVRAAAFVFGALWGSFFNVAIYRWPREMSVVSPPSHCPHCEKPVPAWRNVPIVGYLLLRGKTACCGKPLSPRYLLVELAGAVLAVAIAEQYLVRAAASTPLEEAALCAGLFFAFVGGLLVATFVDLEWMEIPDEVSIGGTALGLATVMFRQPGPDAMDVAIGAGGSFLLVQVLLVWSWERLTGRRGMGEGDSKLLMFAGAFLGWQGAIFALVAGALQGLLVSGIVIASGRRLGASASTDEPAPPDPDWVAPAPLELADGTKIEVGDGGHRLSVRDRGSRLLWEHVIDPDEQRLLRRAIPFGPFLALGALEFLFFGEQLTELYLGLFD